MNIGIPKESKKHENRVALMPSAAWQLVQDGHHVIVQRGAGAGCGYPDNEYLSAGCTLVDGTADVFATVNLARKLRIDPERELRATSSRFRERFLHVERRLAESGRTPTQSNLEEMDAFWDEAKRLERERASSPADTPENPS